MDQELWSNHSLAEVMMNICFLIDLHNGHSAHKGELLYYPTPI